MSQHPIALLIEKADKAINQENFDTVVDLYAEDAVLAIRPGMNAVGKAQIRRAMKPLRLTSRAAWTCDKLKW